LLRIVRRTRLRIQVFVPAHSGYVAMIMSWKISGGSTPDDNAEDEAKWKVFLSINGF